jgi:mono/diheme cytochrome c family protein
MKHWIRWQWNFVLGLLLLSAAAAGGAPANASSQKQGGPDGEVIFKQKCASCHTIGGGRLVGPDLAGVTSTRDADWLRQMIIAPENLFAQKDALALQLLEEYNGLRMPNMGLTEQQTAAVLVYLGGSSDGPATLQGAVLPAGGALSGQKLFSGENRFANGGMACSACHAGTGLGFLDGGSLGPDLRTVYARYGDGGLASSLSPVVFPSMQGAYKDRPLTSQELADLIAYLQWSEQQTAAAPPASGSGWLLMLGIGTAGALLLFGVLALFWPAQRQSLVEQLRSRRQ